MRFALLFLIFLFPTEGRAGDLADRLVAGLNTIWPNEIFEITFDGCQMTFVQVSALKPVITSKEIWHLGDWDTDPRNVELISQNMTDGVKQWKNVQVIYRIKPEVLARNVNDVARFSTANDEILYRPAEGSAWAWWWDPHAEQEKEDRIHSALSKDLHGKRLAGDFGSLIQRNHGFAIVGTDDQSRFELTGYPFEPMGFLFRDDVLDGLLNDFHEFAVSACGS